MNSAIQFAGRGDDNWMKAILDLLGKIYNAILSISSPPTQNITVSNAIIVNNAIQTFTNIEGIVVRNTSPNQTTTITVNGFPVKYDEVYTIMSDTNENIMSVTVDATGGEANVQIYT